MIIKYQWNSIIKWKDRASFVIQFSTQKDVFRDFVKKKMNFYEAAEYDKRDVKISLNSSFEQQYRTSKSMIWLIFGLLILHFIVTLLHGSKSSKVLLPIIWCLGEKKLFLRRIFFHVFKIMLRRLLSRLATTLRFGTMAGQFPLGFSLDLSD